MTLDATIILLFVLSLSIVVTESFFFIAPHQHVESRSCQALASTMAESANLYDPLSRDETYGSNIAKYLVDLHDSEGTFDFCGGMMFQFRLTEKLRSRLALVAESGGSDQNQPVVHGASFDSMAKIPDYEKSAAADNIRYFHGREIRSVPSAKGGRGFVLELSDSEGDPEGERGGGGRGEVKIQAATITIVIGSWCFPRKLTTTKQHDSPIPKVGPRGRSRATTVGGTTPVGSGVRLTNGRPRV